uniref:von Hippel-Lindau disease tumor suppressor-like n=1 Tax=Salmo trutta TaxID=8032 RepID=A0A674AP01_SALTR
RAEQHVENKTLWSVNSDVETHVNFINQWKQSARAWWLDFSGHPVSYGDIRTSGLLRMNTFLTHPWLFRASRNGAKLLTSLFLSCVPVYSLQECCLMLIRNLVEEEDYDRLDIPESLKTDLRQQPDLLKELGIGVLT